MADDLGDGDADDERAVELSSLAAIYPELERNPARDPFSASIVIVVEPILPLKIRFPSADGAPPTGLPTPPGSTSEGISQLKVNDERDSIQQVKNANQGIHLLSHLPPLILRLSLPEGYPAKKPPVLLLESQHSWLPGGKLRELREAGHTLWEEVGRDQVLFAYIDHLQDSAESGFGLDTLEILSDLKVSLLDFDLQAKRQKFERQTFECGICLEPKKGSVCHRLLLCTHIFCVDCLQDFYTACITEGDVGNVKCMAPNCGKEKNVATGEIRDCTIEPSELLQIPLEQQTVQRYIKLKRKKRLESDRSTVYCPRGWCQGPARTTNRKADLGEGAEEKTPSEEPRTYDRNTNADLLPPPAERLAICEDCTFAFCKVCKASWHGEYFICFPRSQFELTAEEKKSEEYMKLHTQPCPTCDARAQKTHGCNHMICFKCDTHFCYLCGGYLDKDNPYAHYNTIKSSCYMRLWELEGGDDGEIGLEFGGGARVLAADDVEGELPPPHPPAAPAPPAAHAPPPAPARLPANGQNRLVDAGLQRALRMIQDDEEDEWDSDDLGDDFSDAEWDDEA